MYDVPKWIRKIWKSPSSVRASKGRPGRVLFFTGAGLSADSGVPTFRGVDGLYKGIRAEEILSETNYRRNPDVVNKFLDERREHIGGVVPNAVHRGIADFCKRYPNSMVFTQNVDDLLERAGVDNVVHLHGSLRRLRCIGFGHVVKTGYYRDPEMRCTVCNSRLRADVVMFGEHAPLYGNFRAALREHTEKDALVVIGTEGSVIPIGVVATMIPGLKILNNLHHSEYIDESYFDEVYIESAITAFPKIETALGEWLK